MRAQSRLFQISYELALLLALLVFALAPIHRLFTANVNVEGVVDATHVYVPASAAPGIAVGDTYPVYRFNPGWKTSLGYARVERIQGDRAILSFDPAVRVGRQGLVTHVDGSTVTISLGSATGVKAGDNLFLFRGREPVGRVELTQVRPDSSSGELVTSSSSVDGAVATEFTVPTQIVVTNQPVVALGEIIAVVLLICAYGIGWLALKRSPLEALGERLRSLVLRFSRPTARLVGSLVLGIPFTWIVIRFSAGVLVRLTEWLAHESVYRVESALMTALPVLYALGGIAYIAALVRYRRSPILLFWEAIAFRGGPLRSLWPSPLRDAVVWVLHLTIAYAFALALFVFIANDMNAALQLAWPNSGVVVHGSFDLWHPGEIRDLIATTFAGFAYMATHSPHISDIEIAYAAIRNILWTLTIFAVLFGYGHSIFGYLWGKKIRNLDYTVPGWIFNAACYGTLLGAVVWAMVPPLMGRDPIFASGPLLHLDLATELFLNIVYMLTIVNLGTMFGVMTDKGVRTTGYYSVVRHPSYTMEALMFVALELRGLTGGAQWLAVAMFLITYWVRSERDDQFMSASNPDYEIYKDKTPYKFIPGLY